MTTTRRARLTLTDLLNAANKLYDEGYLSVYFHVTSDGPRTGSGDTLGEFIVRELCESFDEKSSRKRQVATAVHVLERAKEDIQNAIDGLQELEPGSQVGIAWNSGPLDGPHN